MDAAKITAELKRRAGELGFALSGVCPAAPPPGAARLDAWLAAGYAGDMHYLPDRREAYADPQHVLEGVRSILMLAMNYRTVEPHPPQAGEGRASRYAWGDADYHDVIRGRLNLLIEFLHELAPRATARGVVDTAPLLEREFAQLAGLGWIGKNTLLLNRQNGSLFFLAAMLTDAELQYDSGRETDHCGTCRACLEACPTDAFPQPYVLDASRCISYLTIELRSPIPAELRSGMGEWVFGCDVCQDVCPWNTKAPLSQEAAFQPRVASDPLDLIALFDLDDAAFRARFRDTPLWRPRRRGILRNAAVALGNQPTAVAFPALVRGLNDDEPLIRGACAWALGKHGHAEAIAALKRRLTMEPDSQVRREIEAALPQSVDSQRSQATESSPW